LTTDEGLLPGLTYWNNRKVFLSEVELSESIVAIKDNSLLPRLEEEEHPFFKHPRWAQLPEIYFKWGADGYELGLKVQRDWWKHLCESGEIGEPGKSKSNADGARGSRTSRL